MWLVLAFGSAIFAALVAIFGKIGISGVDSTLATTIRSGFMFVFLFVLSLSTGRLSKIWMIDAKPMKYIILSGLAGALSWLCYFAALKIGLAHKVASIDRLSVVFVIILAAIFLGESLTTKTVLGVTLLTIGAILLTI